MTATPATTNPQHRILIVGKRGGILHWPEHLIEACSRLQVPHQFLALNHQNNTDRLLKKAKKLVSKKLAEQHLAQQLRSALETFKPTLIIFPDLIALTPPFQTVLREHKGTAQAVYWIGDFYPDSITNYNGFINRFYFTDSHLLQQGRALGLNSPQYLPLAVDGVQFSANAQPWETRQDRILFVGAYSDNRYETLKSLQFPMAIYGKGWDKPLPPSHAVHPENIPLKQVATLYGSHKYVLNIINRNNIVNGLNMRCFEATAAGALLITDLVTDLASCFHQEQEVLAYQDAGDIAAMLSQPQEVLAAIAARGQSRTLQEHDYENRLQRLMESCQQLP